MKTAVFASALFASLALAAPVNKRAYVTKTNTVVETVMVYTTVWDGQQATEAPVVPSPAPVAEEPQTPDAEPTPEAVPSSSAVPVVISSSTPEPVVTPTPEPEPEVPSSTPEPEPTPTPIPEPEPEVPSSTPEPTPTPTPTPTPAPVIPEPEPVVPSSTTPSAPAQTESTGSGSGSGETYSGSLTMNYYKDGTGACGENISDTAMVAALSVEGFGASSYDVATGNPTNKWCNQKIRITYNGQSADAVIMDRCAGCTGLGGLDATPALWEALTGGIGGASGDRLETGMSFTLLG